MARKKPNGSAAAEETVEEQTQQGNALVLISEKALRSLLKQDDNYKGQIDGLVGELRESIGNAVDKKHLNKKMYGLLKKFHRYTSDEQLSDDWHTLLAYMDMAGVMKRIDSIDGLPLSEPQETEERVPLAAE